MKAIVDQDACISCGLCPNVCPSVFYFNGDDKAEAKEEPIPSEMEASAQEAKDGCPVDAITLQ